MLYKMTEEQWDEVVDIHLKGPFLCIQAASKYMMEKKQGKIINVTSLAGSGGDKRTDQLQCGQRRHHLLDQIGSTRIGRVWGYGECHFLRDMSVPR